MSATIPQRIIGELITRNKYTFVDEKLIASIVKDAIDEYEMLTDKKED
jgi:hypothetical protein